MLREEIEQVKAIAREIAIEEISKALGKRLEALEEMVLYPPPDEDPPEKGVQPETP